MQDANVQETVAGESEYVVSKEDLQLLYSDAPVTTKQDILVRLGPLRSVFAGFIDNEQLLTPFDDEELADLFDRCSDHRKSVEELLSILRKLAPGNGRIGFRQVNFLVDHLRKRIAQFLHERDYHLDLLPHDHAFGSGGDFWKTGHATTNASIVVAPLLPICKTGTVNITAEHGSYQAAREIGYHEPELNARRLNDQLSNYGFAFVPLSSLGFPYSRTLTAARRRLWEEALELLRVQSATGGKSWQYVVKTTDVPLDILKIVSPNAQVLNPVNHSTGVCHLKMIPYVLAIYMHLGSTGLIAHCYDGIDEISNASSDMERNAPNNLVIKVESDRISIAEFSPEDLGFVRADLSDIAEEKVLKNDAEIFWRILSGTERGPKRNFIVANASMLLVAGHKVPGDRADIVTQLRAGTRMAEHLIDSEEAYDNFRQLLASQP